MKRRAFFWAVAVLASACHEGDPHDTSDPIVGAWREGEDPHLVYFHKGTANYLEGPANYLDDNRRHWGGTWKRTGGVLQIDGAFVCEEYLEGRAEVVLSWLVAGHCPHPDSVSRTVTLTRAPYLVVAELDAGFSDVCTDVIASE